MALQNEGRAYTCFVKNVNINAVADTPVSVPFAKYVLRTMSLTNASMTLAASPATIGAYTGAGATGTTLVTPAVATSLTGPLVINDRTVAATTVVNTAPTVYVRVGVVDGTAGTVDVYFEFQGVE